MKKEINHMLQIFGHVPDEYHQFAQYLSGKVIFIKQGNTSAIKTFVT